MRTRFTLLLTLATSVLARVAFAAPAPSPSHPSSDAGAPNRHAPASLLNPTNLPPARTAAEREARAFLSVVVPLVQPVLTASSEASWAAATDVTPEHTGQRIGADKVSAALSGSTAIINRCRALLAQHKDLTPLTERQLRVLLLSAAQTPATVPDVVRRRVEAEARQSAILDGYPFCLEHGPNGTCKKPVSANDIDDKLLSSRDLKERAAIWRASKEIGGPLKPGIVELRDLRNQVARALGYSSFFALEVADYDMSVAEMMILLDNTLKATRPLYEQLHCWAKTQLAARYAQPVPHFLPAHWVGNRWAQHWPGLIASANLDPLFTGKTAPFIVKSAEDFYVSLGFPRLPASFWERSDLYPVATGGARKKNTHASAWHIDGEQDVRSLMSVEPNAEWFGTAHHELGHIYYYLSYTRPQVPYLLRAGANRAFHEAVGELARLASQETPYLEKIGLLPAQKAPDATSWLLDAALDSLVFLPFSAGTMSHFERDLYEDELPASQWQDRWWDAARRFQGVEPPSVRPDDLCDACTKTHINDDPAQYYDYALATLIKFQLHDHICRTILKQDVRSCDYSGHAEVGRFLKSVLEPGATRDWRALIKETTGHAVGPEALLRFFEPLGPELAKRNAGQNCGF